MRITVVSIQEWAGYIPVPIQTLVRVLLHEGHAVKLIGENVGRVSADIRNSPQYEGHELPVDPQHTVLSKLRHRFVLHGAANRIVEACMEDSDCLWITSPSCVRVLGKNILRYKTVMEFLELQKCGYHFKRFFKIDFAAYARQVWKNVAVEENRAYIEQIWWDLPKVPHVLPNKPFSLDLGAPTPELDAAIARMNQEKRKIILYLGGIYADRHFETFAKAIARSGEYVMYLAGRMPSPKDAEMVQHIVEEYSVVYLGSFTPPNHLALVSYARIGLLPYQPEKGTANSELNALYCAPNKIFEYSGFGVPMVGSDVLGLKLPFAKWNMGVCCDIHDEASILRAIETVDADHDEMSKNCYKFYDSVDLEKIISEILEDEN